MAGAFILGGVAALALAGDVMTDSGDPMPNWGNVPFVAAGTIATVVGVFISPLAIRLLASGAARLPVAMRLALRDLGCYQARSGAAPAAISLALDPRRHRRHRYRRRAHHRRRQPSPTANCSSEPPRRLWTAAANRAGRRRRSADGGRPGSPPPSTIRP